MSISHKQECYSYQELNLHLFGKKFSWVINGFTLLILFGTTGVMLSGTGSIFEEQFGVSYQIGVLVTIILCILTIYRGMSGVMWVNSLVVPMMLIFTSALGFHLIQKGIMPLDHYSGSPAWQGVISPFLYVGFNLAMAQAVLVPLGKDIHEEKILRWGGLLGGLGLGLMLFISHFSLLYHFDTVKNLDIPMAQVISQFGRLMSLLFTLVVFGEIFTTVIGNVFGMMRQVHSTFKISEPFAAIMILLGSFILSQWGFRYLVSLLYPVFGAIGLLFMLRLIVYRKL